MNRLASARKFPSPEVKALLAIAAMQAALERIVEQAAKEAKGK